MDKHRVRKKPQKRIDPHLLARLQASSFQNTKVIKVDTSTKLKVEEKDGPKSLKDITIHPLLLGKDDEKKEAPVVPTKVKKGKRGFNVNPYLDQTTMLKNKKRDLNFIEPGKYIAKAEEMREQLRLAREQDLKLLDLKAKGLLPDLGKGENLYQPQEPPSIEWWDQAYLGDRNYNHVSEPERTKYMEISEENPVTHYIQFPIVPKIDGSKLELKLYLTKNELKKKRRVERLIKHKLEQENIRAGLLPPPPPKVKLKNLMQVLTHELIKDPTALELKVRYEMEQRHNQHLLLNEERKLKPEEKSVKNEMKLKERLDKDGIHCSIFKVGKLSNPYKVNVNASQLSIRGCCVITTDFTMVILEGDYKNIHKFENLLLNRIDWRHDKNGNEIENECNLVTKFKETDFKFHRWFTKEFNDTEELVLFLDSNKITSYYRQMV